MHIHASRHAQSLGNFRIDTKICMHEWNNLIRIDDINLQVRKEGNSARFLDYQTQNLITPAWRWTNLSSRHVFRWNCAKTLLLSLTCNWNRLDPAVFGFKQIDHLWTVFLELVWQNIKWPWSNTVHHTRYNEPHKPMGFLLSGTLSDYN